MPPMRTHSSRAAIAWTLAAALAGLGPGAASASDASPDTTAENRAPRTATPDFAAAVRVLDLDRSIQFAEKSRRMLDTLLASGERLETEVTPLAKGEDGKVYVRGSAPAGEPALDWLDELGDPPPTHLGDFVLRAEAQSESELRRSRLSFRSVVGLAPSDVIALNRAMLAQLGGSDAAIVAAYRRDLPRLAAWSARFFDLSRVRLLAAEQGPDFTALAIEVPLDEDALDESYPSLAKLLSWAREVRWRVGDERGRVLATFTFDGDERVFRAHEWVRDGELVWSDGQAPLRDASGALVPVAFDLGHDARFRVAAEASAVLFKLGPLRMGSFDMPSSELEARYLGDAAGQKADWQLRLRSISDAPALVEWMLPLTQLRESLIRTFQVSLVSAPGGEAPGLHQMVLSGGAELPRSASLDFAQAMARWATDSFSIADWLRASRDFAAAAEQDLSALRAPAPAVARAEP